MRNRSTLILMEQLLMILIFACACALCLQVFAKAEKISHETKMRDNAIVLAQNAAEIIKGNNGDMKQSALWMQAVENGEEWIAYYDENGNPIEKEEAKYRLEWKKENTQTDFLGKALIEVYDTENLETSLFSFSVSWQEVGQ